MATDIKNNMEKEFDQTIKECTNIPLESDLSKKEALRILVEEAKLLTVVDKRSSDKEERERRKDHEFFQESQDKERLSLEKSRYNLDQQRQVQELDYAKRRIDLEEKKINLEIENTRYQNELHERERKDRILTTCLTIGCTLVTTLVSVLVPVLVARKQFYVMARMSYIDADRVCPELKDSTKLVQKFISKK